MKLKSLMTLGLLLTVGLNSAAAATSKSQRRLVIVSELTKFGMKKYEWLYKFLDASTISMAQMMLSGQYQSIRALAGESASKSNYISKLRYYTNLSSVKAVDSIMSAHGSKNKLWFFGGSVKTPDLKANIVAGVPNKHKLRLMYNLACYGQTHNNEFVGSGFRTSIGAVKTNTASASEYPVFLSRFAANHKVKDIIALTNADPGMFISDNAAKFMGFPDANSRKYIYGEKNLRMNYNAH